MLLLIAQNSVGRGLSEPLLIKLEGNPFSLNVLDSGFGLLQLDLPQFLTGPCLLLLEGQGFLLKPQSLVFPLLSGLSYQA
jgi:hypothetical protein